MTHKGWYAIKPNQIKQTEWSIYLSNSTSFFLSFFLILLIVEVPVTDCISHSTNTIGKGMNPIILPPAIGK